MNDLHDGRVKGHAHPELGGFIAVALDILHERQHRFGIPPEHRLTG